MKYCPDCGNALGTRTLDGIERQACVVPPCDFVHWNNPVPVVAVLLQYQAKILLVRNSPWPAGMFSLVSGFLERNETPEQAVVREVKEELNLDSQVQDFICCQSLFAKNQLILAFWGTATGDIKTNDEIADVKLLTRQELSLWSFGPLTLTSNIVSQWLAKTSSNGR